MRQNAGELRALFDAANNVWTVQGDVNEDGVADLETLVATIRWLVETSFSSDVAS